MQPSYTKQVSSHSSDLSAVSPATRGSFLLSFHTARLTCATVNVLTTAEHQLLMKHVLIVCESTNHTP